MPAMKLGMNAHVADARDLHLANYLDSTILPPIPEVFGHAALVADGDWQMFLNDQIGDCLPAGAAHESMVLSREGNHHPAFDDAAVEQAYSEMTGYVPGDPSTDQGTDPRSAAKFRATTGILDARGHRHRIGAYLWLKPGDLEQLWHALYLFGTVGVGYELPESAQQQFAEGKPWDVVNDSPILGGHYVPAFGRRSGGFIDAVSWGQRIGITSRFYERFSNCALAYVSAAALNNEGLTPEGLDLAELRRDLPALSHLSV